MKLSQGEKLILLALASQQDGEEQLDLAFIRKCILSGNTWALTWKFVGVPTDDVSPAIAEETSKILSMWSYIEHSVSKLEREEREALEKSVYPYDLEFSGFDGNHDPHHQVACFLVEDMKSHEDFQGRSLNSHTQTSLPHYRKMLPFYETALRETSFGGGPLSAEQIATIVRAGRD